ncbi:MAG: DMT family transporter [Limnohabitans sp.]|jgi:drug/metabolite transporter (DMT)-like permease
MHRSQLLALGAILLWASLAVLGVRLAHLPPFWLTGVTLLLGSAIALPLSRLDFAQWRVPLRTLALGVYGLFGFHFLLFIALRHAPPVQANLVNYLWPLGMVVLAPVLLPGLQPTLRQLLAALLGFAGAALAISGGQPLEGGLAWGYLPALGSAFVWASYSLLTQRVPPFATSAIGLFALVSGLLSLLCHALLEAPVTPQSGDWPWLLLMGLGPLGAAFFLWDAALKCGDARQIGLLSFLTPLLSTVLLLWHRGEAPSPVIGVSATLIVGAAWLGRGR